MAAVLIAPQQLGMPAKHSPILPNSAARAENNLLYVYYYFFKMTNLINIAAMRQDGEITVCQRPEQCQSALGCSCAQCELHSDMDHASLAPHGEDVHLFLMPSVLALPWKPAGRAGLLPTWGHRCAIKAPTRCSGPSLQPL